VARTQGAIATDFEHDEIGRLLRQQARRKDADPVIRRDYAYDAAGRLGAVDDLRSGTTRYLYDPADRLVEVQGLNPEHFVHDPAGNLLGDSAQAGQVRGDRLMMIGDRHFEYDEAGNRVEERRGTGGALVTRYAWDADHRLKRVETPNGVVEFHYDALGRRTRKRSSAGETRFVHVGLNLLSETGASETRTWVFEPSSFRPLAMIDDVGGAGAAGAGAGADAGGVPVGTEASRRISHYHLDHLGTPREMTDDTGRIVWSARPRAYGALALAEVNEVSNPLRFQGQYHDIETGLYYNLNRYYDPHTGRFLNQDPIGLAGGDNAYRYVPNPVNWVDPLGWVAKGGCGDAKPVEKYEVGTFDDLKSRSVVGDNLDIHHVTQKHAGGQVIPGYEQGSAPAIALPRGEHSRIPTIKGEYTESARDLLANDIRNLRDYTSTPNSSLRDLIDLNKTMYPDSFGK
jgi:RHS repeat-associated protein